MYNTISFKQVSAAALLFLAAALCSAADSADTVTIRSIKIQIGNSKYVIKSAEDILQKSGDFIKVETIMSYSTLAPGRKIKLDSLELEVSLFKQRLEASGLFFNPEVYIVPPRLDPAKRTIVVKVRKGVLSRFGGGLLFAYWGERGTGGRRNSLDLSAGANFNEAAYREENLFNAGIMAGAGITYENSLFNESFPAVFHDLKVDARIGFRPVPDLLLFASGGYRCISYSEQDLDILDGITVNDSYSYFKLSPGIQYDIYTDFGLSAGISSSFSLIFDQQIKAVLNAGANISFSAGPLGLRENVKYSHAYSGLPFPEKASIYPGFRSPAGFAEGTDDSILSSESRISMDLFSVVLFSIFPVSFNIFGFFDIASLSPGGSEFLFERTFTAFGPGAGIYFESPVFLHIDFSFGWNSLYQYKFNFTVYGG